MLQKVSVACNEIRHIPPEIALLEDLRYLDVSFNQITSYLCDCASPGTAGTAKGTGADSGAPACACALTVAEQLPEELALLEGLERMNASFNPLGAVDPMFPEVLTHLPSLAELNLDYTGITELRVRYIILRGLLLHFTGPPVLNSTSTTPASLSCV
eukprot:1241987-Pyramimonas_sp.AAC.1